MPAANKGLVGDSLLKMESSKRSLLLGRGHTQNIFDSYFSTGLVQPPTRIIDSNSSLGVIFLSDFAMVIYIKGNIFQRGWFNHQLVFFFQGDVM